MREEIEIEFKMLLSKEEFTLLLTELDFPKHSVEQTNHYFETDTFTLKKHKSALRIREKNGTYTLTLKEPHEKGILERHESLSETEAEQWIKGINRSNTPAINHCIKKMGVEPNSLNYYGGLRTERYEFVDDNIVYVLDKSFYNDMVDYELEIEADDYELGLSIFQGLLSKFKIKKKKTVTKIERFFKSLQ